MLEHGEDEHGEHIGWLGLLGCCFGFFFWRVCGISLYLGNNTDFESVALLKCLQNSSFLIAAVI